MAGVPPLPLPPPQAMPAVRVDVPLSDGSYAQQLVASDGSAVANSGFAAAGRAAAEKATAVVMDAPPWTNGPQDGPSA